MTDIQNNQYSDDDKETEEPEQSTNRTQRSNELNKTNKFSLTHPSNKGNTSSSSLNAANISTTTARTSDTVSQINIPIHKVQHTNKMRKNINKFKCRATTREASKYQTRSATGASPYPTEPVSLTDAIQKPPPVPLSIRYYSDDVEIQSINDGCKLNKLLSIVEANEAKGRLEKYPTQAIWNGTTYCTKRRMASLRKIGPAVIMQQKIVNKLTEMGELDERNLSNATTLHSMENTPAQKYHRDFNP